MERNFTISDCAIRVLVPRTRDHSGGGITLSSALVPRYMRRSLSIEEAIQLLHLFGISSNNMVEGVQTLLDSPVKGLSATNINRMKMQWKKEFEAWKSRDLSDK